MPGSWSPTLSPSVRKDGALRAFTAPLRGGGVVGVRITPDFFLTPATKTYRSTPTGKDRSLGAPGRRGPRAPGLFSFAPSGGTAGAESVRLDPRVLEWLRSKGEGHLTRINDILTNRMEAERRTGSGR